MRAMPEPLPLVSICIPTHDDAAVVGDALRSVLLQDYIAMEVLVLDNCSADDTERVVQHTATGDGRVRYVRHDSDIGMAANFSACVHMARGEFVQILCADDALEPGCVTFLAEALSQHVDAALAACGRKLTDESLRPSRVLRARDRRELVPGPVLARECFARGNRIGEPSAVMFRRGAAARGFNAEYNQLVDLEMWLHLLAHGPAVLLPQPLCRVRQHGRQATQTNIRSGRLIEDKRRLFRQFEAAFAPALGVAEKLRWDTRMASSVARMRAAGGVLDARAIAEVFFRRLFAQVLVPAVTLARRGIA
ncbi:MAG TPA: glycosyltransferase family 2 protein [Burkholderiales bacterium]|nr:glycosyltransferase family 2 protein [Burkholderiales bacterium]